MKNSFHTIKEEEGLVMNQESGHDAACLKMEQEGSNLVSYEKYQGNCENLYINHLSHGTIVVVTLYCNRELGQRTGTLSRAMQYNVVNTIVMLSTYGHINSMWKLSHKQQCIEYVELRLSKSNTKAMEITRNPVLSFKKKKKSGSRLEVIELCSFSHVHVEINSVTLQMMKEIPARHKKQ
ncbi:hypothetical protein BTVI_125334 [Pitangus sulphuratus]|nr:hypothetical protein BTVI_125334 [Pitangus sulphuratus]